MEDECETTDLLQQEQPSDCVVRLVKAVCVPANHMKMIEAQAIGCGERSVFQPVQKFIEQHGLQMANAIVEPGEAGKMTLIVENHSHQPIDLESSYVLGCLHPVERVLPDDRAQEEKGKIVQYAFTDWGMPPDGRAARIMEAIGLNKSELTSEEQSRLESLICQYQNLFALEPSDLGTTELVTHSIHTGDHPPISQPLRHTPFALREKMAEMVEDMFQWRVIQPSSSPWTSPVVLVEKDKTIQFCIDYHRLNAVTKMDVLPLPRVDDSSDLLSKSRYFTTLDLSSGYWQVKMNPASREKTAHTLGSTSFSPCPSGFVTRPPPSKD